MGTRDVLKVAMALIASAESAATGATLRRVRRRGHHARTAAR